MSIITKTNKGWQVQCGLMGCKNLCNSLIGLCDDCLDEVYRTEAEQKIYDAEKQGIEILESGIVEGVKGWKI